MNKLLQKVVVATLELAMYLPKNLVPKNLVPAFEIEVVEPLLKGTENFYIIMTSTIIELLCELMAFHFSSIGE